jgi:pyridoxine 4-dehydrogenase
MQLRLGDKEINRIGYGAMRLPGIRELPGNTELSIRLLREAVSLGANVIDTADYYGDGLANRLIAEALRPYPDELVIATKVGVKGGPGGRPEPAASADEIRATVERDLESLGLSSLDLVFLRLPGGPLAESGVPIEQSMECLAELQADGMIRHIGLSSTTTGQIEAAKSVTSVDAVQNIHFVGNAAPTDVIHFCESENIPFLAYFPLGMGILIQKKVDLGPFAANYQATESQIALAWLLALSPVIVPIPGSSSVEHVRENMAASSLSLSQADVEALSNVA